MAMVISYLFYMDECGNAVMCLFFNLTVNTYFRVYKFEVQQNFNTILQF